MSVLVVLHSDRENVPGSRLLRKKLIDRKFMGQVFNVIPKLNALKSLLCKLVEHYLVVLRLFLMLCKILFKCSFQVCAFSRNRSKGLCLLCNSLYPFVTVLIKRAKLLF